MNTNKVPNSTHAIAWLLAALTGLASAACADDETKSPARDSSLEPFGNCSRGVLESDRRDDEQALAGPGVDPATGRLKPGSYLIATTYLALKQDKAERALELGGPVVQSLFTMKGFVAFSTTQSSNCASLRTLTIWQSEEDMLAFVTSPAHLSAMSAVSELSRGTSNTVAWEGGEKEATWERAANYLAAETGGEH